MCGPHSTYSYMSLEGGKGLEVGRMANSGREDCADYPTTVGNGGKEKGMVETAFEREGPFPAADVDAPIAPKERKAKD